jgi:hypothetical protein
MGFKDMWSRGEQGRVEGVKGLRGEKAMGIFKLSGRGKASITIHSFGP